MYVWVVPMFLLLLVACLERCCGEARRLIMNRRFVRRKGEE